MQRALRALGLWATSWVAGSGHWRDELCTSVQKLLGSNSIFSFGSGRSALATCLKAAKIGHGDEVVLSAFTCQAVPTAVLATGAVPVYVDINSHTLNVDVTGVISAFSHKTRAIIVQHTLGKIAPIQEIIDFAKNRGLLVIEDCALSVGSKINGKYIGTFGDAAIFSMELSKTISCGWGGILAVNNKDLAIAVSRDYATVLPTGFWRATCDLWQTVISAWSYHPRVFYLLGKYVLVACFRLRVFRLSTPDQESSGSIPGDFIRKLGTGQMRLATEQWRNLEHLAALCERNAKVIRSALLDLRLIVPGLPLSNEVSVAPRVSFLVFNRPVVQIYFEKKGIALGQWFDGPPAPLSRYELFNYQPECYPVAECLEAYIVNLPCHSAITTSDLRRIIEVLKSFVVDLPDCIVYEQPNVS
jgi:dTDP-4-amino-4,6-dideoxygalactose transaminase